MSGFVRSFPLEDIAIRSGAIPTALYPNGQAPTTGGTA